MALSPRYKKFANNIVEGMTGKAAAIDAGFAPKSAEAAASRLLRNVKVQEAIGRSLEGEGSVLSRTVQLLKDVSDHGTSHDQLKACQVILKLYGLL